MGCGCTKTTADDPKSLNSDEALARKLQEDELRAARRAQPPALVPTRFGISRTVIHGTPPHNFGAAPQVVHASNRVDPDRGETGCTGGTGGFQDWGTSGGRVLGGSGCNDLGSVPEDLRQRQLDAAQQRQVTQPGLSQERSAELLERRQKEELLGKLTEHYSRARMDVPMGLNAASVEQLRRHLEQVRKGDHASNALQH